MNNANAEEVIHSFLDLFLNKYLPRQVRTSHRKRKKLETECVNKIELTQILIEGYEADETYTISQVAGMLVARGSLPANRADRDNDNLLRKALLDLDRMLQDYKSILPLPWSALTLRVSRRNPVGFVNTP
jgi:hypothetical protein